MSFRARPAAKLNLTLEVGERRADGFHPLRSVFLRFGLSDRLSVRQAADDRDRLTVTGLALPVGDNLVQHAVALLRRRVGLQLPGLEAELEKNIPVGAGLAGGSSDAAAMINLAAACWGVGLSDAERLEMAAVLGSDVPFFAADTPAALVEGRGERVTPLPGVHGRPGLVLVTPPVQISTAAAFAASDELGSVRGGNGSTTALAAALSAGMGAEELAGWSDRLRDANDLWPAAVLLAPEIDSLRSHLEQQTQRPWLLTGSGSALFAFYASPDEAARAGARLVGGPSAGISGSLVLATDLEGPDPVWRQP